MGAEQKNIKAIAVAKAEPDLRLLARAIIDLAIELDQQENANNVAENSEGTGNGPPAMVTELKRLAPVAAVGREVAEVPVPEPVTPALWAKADLFPVAELSMHPAENASDSGQDGADAADAREVDVVDRKRAA